jgi:hypothetical protein
MNGKTTGEAQADRLRRYEDEMAYWLTGPGSTYGDAAVLVRLLAIDKEIAVMLGRSDVRVTTSIAVPRAPTPTMAYLQLPVALGLALVIASQKG